MVDSRKIGVRSLYLTLWIKCQIQRSDPFILIIEEVAEAGNAQADALRDRKTKLKDFRQIAMELSYRYSNCKQTEIGMIFGVDYSTVSQSRARLKAKLKLSRKLKQQFHRIQVQIDKLSE